MNEKVKLLAEQAGFMLWDKETWNPGDVVDWSARYDRELEQFYKLIVRECVIISRSSTNGFSAGRRMEEHFGVES
jgi:hypothetical protein